MLLAHSAHATLSGPGPPLSQHCSGAMDTACRSVSEAPSRRVCRLPAPPRSAAEPGFERAGCRWGRRHHCVSPCLVIIVVVRFAGWCLVCSVF